MLNCLRRAGLLVLALLALSLTPARADMLVLTGVLQDATGRPLPRERFRLVLGSDPAPRSAAAGRMVTTDARGGFALTTGVTLKPRRVRLSTQGHHPSQLLEIGFAFDLLGQPALHWVELDVIPGHGPLRGITTYVAGKRGLFDQPLTFHSRDHSWSIPGDPRGMRLTGPGTDVRVSGWDDSRAGQWQLQVQVIHQSFTLR